MTDINEKTDKTEKLDTVDAPHVVPATILEAGMMLAGKYKVVSILGAGGMGTVYRVQQVFLNKEFALKILSGNRISPLAVRRFQAEARAASILCHPNLVQVNDFGLFDDVCPYLVMDFIDGITLSDHLKQRGPMPVEEAGPLFAQVCLGLAYAHEQGVVHRDIKPSNIMLVNGTTAGTEGSVKVVDFGIAKVVSSEDGEIQALTRTGEIFGSPLYMSPEQCSGELVDHRSDVYSLGCVLFEALTGAPPHIGATALATMMLHQSQTSLPLKQASLGKEFPDDVEKIVKKMLRKSPQERYQNLGVLAHDLARVCRGGTGQLILPKTLSSSKKDKVVTMPAQRFYALLAMTMVATAIIAGLSGYYLKDSQIKSEAANPAESIKSAPEPVIDQGQKLITIAKTPEVENQMVRSIVHHAENQRVVRPRKIEFPISGVGTLWISNALACTSQHTEARGSVPLPEDLEPDDELALELPKTGSIRENPAILAQVDGRALSGLMVTGSDHAGQTSESDWFVKVLRITAAWTNLRSLTLEHCSLNEAIFDAVDNLKRLHNLKLAQTTVDPAALARRRFFHRLEMLIISRSPCDGILHRSANLPNLKTLGLEYCAVSADSLRELRKCPKLEWLSLMELSKLDEQDIQALAQLKNLQTLAFQMQLTPSQQSQISQQCSSLKHIRFSRAYESPSEMVRLSKLDSRIQFQ